MNSVGSILNLNVTVTGLNGQAFESIADVATETSENFDKYIAGKQQVNTYQLLTYLKPMLTSYSNLSIELFYSFKTFHDIPVPLRDMSKMYKILLRVW